MATAVSNLKRSVVTGEVILTLTPAEAVVLRSILGACRTGPSVTEVTASKIYHALHKVPVVFITTDINFQTHCDNLIQAELDTWNPET